MIRTWRQYWHWVAVHHGKHPKPTARILHIPHHLKTQGWELFYPLHREVHIGTAIHVQAGIDWSVMLMLLIFVWLYVREDVAVWWRNREALRAIHENPDYYRQLPKSKAPTIDDPTPARFVNEARHGCGCVTRFDCTYWRSMVVTPCDDHFIAYVANIGGRHEDVA